MASGVLVVDVGGNNMKCWCSTGEEKRKSRTGPDFTPESLIEGVRELCGDWSYDRVTIGVPGPVHGDRLAREPVNLGEGWAGFDFGGALDMPVRLVNDAAMQALGSYDGGTMLFIGLGTGLGNTLVVDGHVVPLEIGHLPFRKGRTYEDYVGQRGLDRLGRKRWRRVVGEVVARFREALLADYVVLGGGNVKELKRLPEGCRRGDNDNAFLGGVRIWDPGR